MITDRTLLFHRLAHAWVLLAMALQLPDADVLWTNEAGRSVLTGTWAAGLLDPYHHLPAGGVYLGNGLLAMLAVGGLFARPIWWRSAILWWLFVAWMNAAWPTSTGGHQLMANLLFWNIGLALPDRSRFLLARTTAFHIVRFQLLLAYLATTLHKLQGHAWLDGSALSQVASDPAWSLGWLAGLPVLARVFTWATLAFQALFPLAVWWPFTRSLFLAGGVVFHVSTGMLLGIPEMGAAFLVAYALWLPEGTARTILEAPRAAVRRLSPTS